MLSEASRSMHWLVTATGHHMIDGDGTGHCSADVSRCDLGRAHLLPTKHLCERVLMRFAALPHAGKPIVRCFLSDEGQRWCMWYSGRSADDADRDAISPGTGSAGAFAAILSHQCMLLC